MLLFKSTRVRTGQTSHHKSAYCSYTKSPGSNPSSHIRWLTTTCITSFRGSDTLSGVQAPALTGSTHIHINDSYKRTTSVASQYQERNTYFQGVFVFQISTTCSADPSEPWWPEGQVVVPSFGNYFILNEVHCFILRLLSQMVCFLIKSLKSLVFREYTVGVWFVVSLLMGFSGISSAEASGPCWATCSVRSSVSDPYASPNTLSSPHHRQCKWLGFLMAVTSWCRSLRRGWSHSLIKILMGAIYCGRGWEFETNAHGSLIETIKVLDLGTTLWLYNHSL